MIKLIYTWIKRPLVLIVLALIIIFIFKKLDLFEVFFKRKPLLIDDTPLVIKQNRSISELNSATLYQDVVVDSIAPGRLSFSAKREIVLIIKGKVSAGID